MNVDFDCAPVLLIGFNRPDFMRAQIDAVRPARPARLYIAVDGPRENRPDEAAKCAAVRDCAKLVDWSCEVKTLFRERNLGCKLAPAQAIDWFFENEDMGIVMEDDTRPTLDFFHFMTEMLERYREDERVGMVSGFNFFGWQRDQSYSYHFSRIAMMSGGWATWRRAWRLYDIDMKPYLPRVDEILATMPMTHYFRRVFKLELERTLKGKDAWDYQFTLMMYATGKLGVVPRVQLITNVGVEGAAATHTTGYNYFSDHWQRLGKLEFPLVHPAEVVCDEWADRRRERMEGAILPRGLTWLGAKMPRLSPFLTAVGHAVEHLAPVFMRWP